MIKIRNNVLLFIKFQNHYNAKYLLITFISIFLLTYMWANPNAKHMYELLEKTQDRH